MVIKKDCFHLGMRCKGIIFCPDTCRLYVPKFDKKLCKFCLMPILRMHKICPNCLKKLEK